MPLPFCVKLMFAEQSAVADGTTNNACTKIRTPRADRNRIRVILPRIRLLETDIQNSFDALPRHRCVLAIEIFAVILTRHRCDRSLTYVRKCWNCHKDGDRVSFSEYGDSIASVYQKPVYPMRYDFARIFTSFSNFVSASHPNSRRLFSGLPRL